MIDKFGTVRLSAFDTTIKWFVGSFDSFIKKYRLENLELENNCLGLMVTHNGQYFIYACGEDIYNTIPHEVVHAIARMAEIRDILFDETNHEMIAYLVGYVSGKILDKINR